MCTLLFRLVLSSAIVASTAVASTGVADARQGSVPPSDQVAAAGRADKGHPKLVVPHSTEPVVPSGGRVRHPSAPEPLRIPHAALEPTEWRDLDDWGGHDHARAFAPFPANCHPLLSPNP